MSSRDPDKLLDHDYDGIKEFDNPLPKWWLWLFYGCIIWSAIYVPWAHLGGHLPGAEYEADVKEAEAAHPRRDPGAGIDLAAAQADTDRIAKGKATFEKLCTPCHGPQAGGLVGPNLTDNFWIHGGKMQNLVTTITNGVPEKGMISWKSQLSPDEIVNAAAFIKSLKGTNPSNPKAAEGQPEE
jgi:cytochrome c oxidase cbb3-type subunit 3